MTGVNPSDIMEMRKRTIFISGGSSGIGFALAKKLIGMGNKVIICGRSADKLSAAQESAPGIHAIRCDISKKADIESLNESIVQKFPEVDMLINNAGIQRQIDFLKGPEDLLSGEDEIQVNLRAHVYLSAYMIPILAKRMESAIVNVSSGLGFIPMARYPIYSATKAAIHSFTMSLRSQLSATNIKVFEVIPPIVYDTCLKGKPQPPAENGITAEEMADIIVSGIEDNKYEITAGQTKKWMEMRKEEADITFQTINKKIN